jgi:hypothetical protein
MRLDLDHKCSGIQHDKGMLSESEVAFIDWEIPYGGSQSKHTEDVRTLRRRRMDSQNPASRDDKILPIGLTHDHLGATGNLGNAIKAIAAQFLILNTPEIGKVVHVEQTFVSELQQVSLPAEFD